MMFHRFWGQNVFRVQSAFYALQSLEKTRIKSLSCSASELLAEDALKPTYSCHSDNLRESSELLCRFEHKREQDANH